MLKGKYQEKEKWIRGGGERERERHSDLVQVENNSNREEKKRKIVSSSAESNFSVFRLLFFSCFL